MAFIEIVQNDQLDQWNSNSKLSVFTTACLAQQGYKLGHTIGEGSYCKVKAGVKFHENSSYTKIACKIVSKRKASEDFISKFLPREINLLKSLHHPNVLQLFDVFETPEYVYIITNLCERGDLLEFIKSKGYLIEYRARIFFRQLVTALNYLHSKDISHRDFKCENIFISMRDHLVIGDFGFARRCCDPDTHTRILSTTFCGSAAYAAPEIIQGIPYNPKMYDMWSLGCVLYIMLSGSMPFDDSNINTMLQMQINKAVNTDHFNGNTVILKLLFQMLEPDVTRRATIQQIAQNEWLQDQLQQTFHRVSPIKYYSHAR